MPLIEGVDLKPGLYHYTPKEHALELRDGFLPSRSLGCWTRFLLAHFFSC